MLPRTRRHLAGHPVVLPPALDRLAEAWWRATPRTRLTVGVVAFALLVTAGIAHAAASPDGPPVEVWVASRDLQPGDRLGDGDVQRRTWPSRFAPQGVLDDPTGTVVAPLPAGAVVTDRHLGDDPLAASVPDGHVAVGVPVDQLPAVAAGTRVDLVGAGPDGTGTHLATDAVVVHTDGETIWIAVASTVAVEVSAAVATATLAAVVRPP
jgi:Flp pilus assembly protein CpaB